MLFPLQGSCGEATERLVLSSTNPPMLPRIWFGRAGSAALCVAPYKTVWFYLP